MSMAGYMGGCSYRNCYKRRSTCSTVTFFQFPNDERRQIWIQNSGNSLIKNLTEKQIRFLCEQHFRSEDLQEQYCQKILTKTAIPIAFQKKPPKDKIKNYKKKILKMKKTECDTLEIVVLDKKSHDFTIKTINSEINEESNEMPEETVEILMKTDDMLPEDNKNESEDELIEISVCKEHIAVENDNETKQDSKVFTDIAPESTQIRERNLKTHNIPTEALPSYKNIEFAVKCGTASKEVQTSEDMSSFQTQEDDESDRHFALSLINNFQRLNPRKKAKAKVDILNYFYKLEFNGDAVL